MEKLQGLDPGRLSENIFGHLVMRIREEHLAADDTIDDDD